jgi:glycosyltransferase involved in cell wall biosynthesis
VQFHQRTGGAPARLDAAGYLSPADREYLAAARRPLERAGIPDRFTYHGELDRDRKLAFLRGLDVLSVPATYDEPKGLFLLEAMASGVPVVVPRRGAFVEIVEQTGGGLLVDPDSPESLAEGLHTLWKDPDLAARLSGHAFDGVRRHYSIERSADSLLSAYDDVLREPRPASAGDARADERLSQPARMA